jgi:hypothetical protein
MNLRRCLLIGLVAAGWLSGRSLRAGAAPSANPYAPIVTRNVFALVPIPVNTGPEVPADPPPKITPNGIMTIFGKLQVLFKVSENLPGQPPKDDSFVMSEGDRQDDIEVQKIDEKAAVITFNNHGVVQELPLVATTAAIPSPSGLGRPALPYGRFNPNNRVPLGYNSPYSRPPDNPANAIPTPAPPPVTDAAPSAPVAPAEPAQPAMPLEQQVIMIEAQRMDMIQKGDRTAAIMPLTEMTSQVLGASTTGGDAPPEPAPEPPTTPGQ